MLRLLVILVSVFALSKVAFATGSAKGSAETTPVTEVSKDAALQDDATAEKELNEKGKGSKK
ncbi:MAG: hypothetical protein KBD25_06685 [Rickettsiaceae bacterium]|jgi:hypothetical protein|uniref:hypothetical protein n=1 Tax=Candidatus Megaera polyxenophila TaxID=988779 RepID=UPI001B77AB51|nr:hypothetical protein [Candidatus Megaera polyxenophila]MBP9778848.1 hypothetical protein [Rickettsiaceae bacterium]MBU6183877.1 hypothetical protein [Rickettsiales bacterium]NBY34795.1 hypothetical protein [Alphaproteobacteria bacterium]UCM93653.1 MAG: hypothetical protein LF888_03940 [Candidatus Megaira endosymbiont of Mesostigma viride]HJK85313.1 hypothetical protein [Candidatus Megaera endosymbiont of Stentor roeselii]